MAYGDVGGAVTELVITCKTESSGDVDISEGQAVKLTGNYVVDNATDAEDVLFGQALSDASENSVEIPVLVKGIAVLEYTGDAPTVDGAAGVLCSATDGKVKAPVSGNGKGINVKVDTTAVTVHVLL